MKVNHNGYSIKSYKHTWESTLVGRCIKDARNFLPLLCTMSNGKLDAGRAFDQ